MTMPMSSMAEAIRKVRLRTTLVLRLIWKRFIGNRISRKFPRRRLVVHHKVHKENVSRPWSVVEDLPVVFFATDNGLPTTDAQLPW
jgi:hypothetical protein